MKAAAIIAEYNPFHLGHTWQLQEIKKTYHVDICIVMMSGNYVQRGAPAIIDKFTRTKWALQYGADIVFELPSIFATAGAEQFASGACMLLDKLGFIDMLCFGSEFADCNFFQKTAAFLLNPPSAYEYHLKELLQTGKSYAAAREEALYPFLAKEIDFQSLFTSENKKKKTAQEQFHTIFSAPNTILGIEYCKALKKRNSFIKPVPLLRNGNYHSISLPEQKTVIRDDKNSPTISASAIRNHLFYHFDSLELLNAFLPQTVFADLSSLTFLQEDDFSLCLYYALLGKNTNTLEKYYEVSPELAQRILHYFPQFQDFSSFTNCLKTKNYAHARIRRALLHILLSIQKEDPFFDSCFLRLLGLKKESSYLLRKMKEQTKLTIITKPSSYQKLLSGQDLLIFSKEIAASQLYGYLSYKKAKITKPYRELAISPIIL